ncbi:MAG: lytic transglycosylase domain-containing protein [Pseudomonadota bacterium]|nr:lytic transglycosylase domain-containing protein [Pseudomonadota bacterium]
MKLFFAALARVRRGATLLAVTSLCLSLQVAPSLADPFAVDLTRDPNEKLVFGPMKVSRWLAETVVRAAAKTGVDPAYLMALADKESSLLPASKAETSSAEGLFQFLESTWLEVLRRYGPKHGFEAAAEAIGRVQSRTVVLDETQRAWILGLRRDPYLSALMAGEMVNAHREILAGKAERDPSFSELYMAHFLGVHGASRFLEILQSKPTATATKEFPKAAKANRAIFTEAKGKRPKHLTMAEVHGRIDAMIDYRVARYEAVRGDLARFASN